jgi:hypothetical protein
MTATQNSGDIEFDFDKTETAIMSLFSGDMESAIRVQSFLETVDFMPDIENESDLRKCAELMRNLKRVQKEIEDIIEPIKKKQNKKHKRWTALEKSTAGKIEQGIDTMKQRVAKYLKSIAEEAERQILSGSEITAVVPDDVPGVEFRDKKEWEVEDAAALIDFLLKNGKSRAISFSKTEINKLVNTFGTIPGVKVIPDYTIVVKAS